MKNSVWYPSEEIFIPLTVLIFFKIFLSLYSKIVGLPKICQKYFYHKRLDFLKYYIWDMGNRKWPISTFWDICY